MPGDATARDVISKCFWKISRNYGYLKQDISNTGLRSDLEDAEDCFLTLVNPKTPIMDSV